MDQPSWVASELQPLLSALRLQHTFHSADLEDVVLSLEEDALEREYNQLTNILANAREALATMVSSD